MDERHDIEGAAAANGAQSANGSSAAAVLAGSEARPLQPAQQSSLLPAPVVAAGGGALVAAVGYVLLRVLRRPARRRGALRIGKGRGRKRGALEVTGSRSFLVDVHVLKR
jgi:hypothetical protein